MSFLIIVLLSLAPLLIIQCTSKQNIRSVKAEKPKSKSRLLKKPSKLSAKKKSASVPSDKPDKAKKKNLKKKASEEGVLEPPLPLGGELDPTQSHETQHPPAPTPNAQLCDTQIDEPLSQDTKKPATAKKDKTLKESVLFTGKKEKKKAPKKEEYWEDQNDDDTLLCVKSID